MYLKKLFIINIIALGLLNIGCNNADVNKEISKENDKTAKITNYAEDKENQVSEKEKNEENKGKEGEDTTNKEKTDKIEKSTDKSVEASEYKLDNAKANEEYPFGNSDKPRELKRDEEYFFVTIDEVPSEIKSWVLANKDKQSEPTAYSKTTSTATYVMASVENDTHGKTIVICPPYTIVDSNKIVVPYCEYHENKLVESNGNEYLIIKIIKPVDVELFYTTLFLDE